MEHQVCELQKKMWQKSERKCVTPKCISPSISPVTFDICMNIRIFIFSSTITGLKTPTTYKDIRKYVLERAQPVLKRATCRILQIAHDKSYRVNRALITWHWHVTHLRIPNGGITGDHRAPSGYVWWPKRHTTTKTAHLHHCHDYS